MLAAIGILAGGSRQADPVWRAIAGQAIAGQFQQSASQEGNASFSAVVVMGACWSAVPMVMHCGAGCASPWWDGKWRWDSWPP